MHKCHKSCSELIWPFYGFFQLYAQKCNKTHISASSVHKYQNRIPSRFEHFTAYYNCISKSVIRPTYLHEFFAQVSKKSCSYLTWWFYGILEMFEQNSHKFHISTSSMHKYHKACSQLIWPFYGLLQLYEQKCHKIRHREFCAQVSQIVFLADLTVLGLISTVWVKMSKTKWYPWEFCAQVSKIVFLADFTVLRINTTVWAKMPWDSHISTTFLHKCQKLVFLADLTVIRHIRNVWPKISQNSYLREFYAQVSQLVFLADLTVLRLITTVWAKMSQN